MGISMQFAMQFLCHWRNIQTIPHPTNYCILLWLVSDSGWDNLEFWFAVDSKRKFTFIFPTPIPCSPVHVPASVIFEGG
jgi:hypothetical protein